MSNHIERNHTIDDLVSRLAVARRDRDEAYRERNHLVRLLAAIYPSGIRATDIEGWDPEWNNCVWIDAPTGQMSWHYHDSDASLFANLPAYDKPWDEHTTEEKYERLDTLIAMMAITGGAVKTP